MQRALFLDRDGVINEDTGYVGKIENFHFIDGVFEALKKAQKRGFLLIVITNQSGIGRGYYTLQDFQELSNYMVEELRKRGIEITDIFFCPHAPEENCSCRKPKPAMILEAAKKHNIDLQRSFMVGDKQSDIEAARNAGVGKAILLCDKKLIDVIEEIV
ncbi:D-glycero-D-manno-heptose 1,7-bisphosphate phosphatase [Nitratiruptor sp. YY08-26]|uniref:D-glycero-beta-D-manno-heptose 1,7-bisphosphate 7-phosphatase n=1 Tax=unclassified Nitratiruptor TaxID=2624044 RepID=UPI001916B2AA|nr:MULTISPECIES: D-glycero-beta-D-manno-heptose 1,7-bisphosphate 7-phosphatase [unclassified Nitratiruptor]BCD62727.1 D-glycero-D-manno-heptose 1,7-bisphosphate phosphatase [Nitratiruptor sp. YY08-13]BCD66663.1 D-glycero-D-manno-heptose 1,7-bisphosphate phosphatase [Nitratiruptor sp. YY08-26]